MPQYDPRVDAYIDNAADFAKPILIHIRETMHAASPDIEEAIKWGFPCFMYKGIVAGMSGFKAHAAFGFWKAALLGSDAGVASSAMGMRDITSIKDLPSKKTIIALARKAMALNDEGVTVKRAPKKARPAIAPPKPFLAALAKNKKAKAAFDAFPPSHKREYLEWITEAKTDATRDKRIAQTIEWVAEGKSRNWKYQR